MEYKDKKIEEALALQNKELTQNDIRLKKLERDWQDSKTLREQKDHEVNINKTKIKNQKIKCHNLEVELSSVSHQIEIKNTELAQVYSIIEQSLRQKEDLEQKVQTANHQLQNIVEDINKHQDVAHDKKSAVQEKLQEVAGLEKRKLKMQQEAHIQRDQLIKYENEHNWLILSIKDFEREIEYLENQNKRNTEQLSKQRENKEKLEERLPYLNTRQDILLNALNQQKSELDKVEGKIDETNTYVLKKEYQLQELEKELEIKKYDLENGNNSLLKKEFLIKELEKNIHVTQLKREELQVRSEQKYRQLKEAEIKEEELSDQMTKQNMLVAELEERVNDVQNSLSKANEEIQFNLNKLGISKEEVAHRLDQIRHSTDELKKTNTLVEDHKKHITQQLHEIHTLERKQQQIHLEREKILNEIADLEETVKYHQLNLHKKQKTISDQKHSLKSELEFLNELRTKVQHFNDEIASSDRICADLESKINDLNAECDNYKKMYEENLQDSLFKKEVIYNLENDINRLSLLADSKKQELRDLSRSLQETNNLIEIKESEQCRLAQDTDAQINLVEQKKKEVTSFKRELEQTEKEVVNLTVKNHSLKKELEDVNNKSLELKRNIDIKNLDLAQGLEELKRQNLQITEKQFSVEKMQDELRSLETESHNVKNDIKSNSIAITIFDTDLDKLKNHIKESQGVIVKLNQKFNSDQTYLKNITEKNSELKFELQRKENEARLLEGQLREISSQTLEWERTNKFSQEKVESTTKEIDKVSSRIFIEESNALKIRDFYTKSKEALNNLETQLHSKEKALQELIDEQKRTNSDINIFAVRKNKTECEIRDFDVEKTKIEEALKQNLKNHEAVSKKCAELEKTKAEKEAALLVLRAEMTRSFDLADATSNSINMSQEHLNIVTQELQKTSLERKIKEDQYQQLIGQLGLVERKIKTCDNEIVTCHADIEKLEKEHESFQFDLDNKEKVHNALDEQMQAQMQKFQALKSALESEKTFHADSIKENAQYVQALEQYEQKLQQTELELAEAAKKRLAQETINHEIIIRLSTQKTLIEEREKVLAMQKVKIAELEAEELSSKKIIAQHEQNFSLNTPPEVKAINKMGAAEYLLSLRTDLKKILGNKEVYYNANISGHQDVDQLLFNCHQTSLQVMISGMYDFNNDLHFTLGIDVQNDVCVMLTVKGLNNVTPMALKEKLVPISGKLKDKFKNFSLNFNFLVQNTPDNMVDTMTIKINTRSTPKARSVSLDA